MHLVIETTDGVRSIAISRPASRNSLSSETLEELTAALRAADESSDVRAVLLQGLPQIFSSGLDLEESLAGKPELFENARAMIEAADSMKKPLIAAVSGPAVGLAVTLLLCCDLVYCSEHALFSMPFTALGEVPSFGLTERLLAECGRHAAAEKLLLSEPITAEQARTLNIVNRVFEEEALLREATARAVRITRLPPLAVIRTKALLKAAARKQAQEQAALEAELCALQNQETESREAHQAFMEGRRPDFSRSSS